MTVQSKFSMAVFAMRIAHKLIISLQNEPLGSFGITNAILPLSVFQKSRRFPLAVP